MEMEKEKKGNKERKQETEYGIKERKKKIGKKKRNKESRKTKERDEEEYQLLNFEFL